MSSVNLFDILLGIGEPLGYVNLYLSSALGGFQPLFLQMFFFFPAPFSPENPMMYVLECLMFPHALFIFLHSPAPSPSPRFSDNYFYSLIFKFTDPFFCVHRQYFPVSLHTLYVFFIVENCTFEYITTLEM